MPCSKRKRNTGINVLIYSVVSSIVTTCFLTVLFVLALLHNFITVHFRKPEGTKDPRDTRASKTEIRPESSPRKHRMSSVSSETPLSLELDEENNIEYDHTITSHNTKPNSHRSATSHGVHTEGNENAIELEENPFNDVLAAEDLRLVPDLKYYYEQYGILIEEHEIETQDGFIIDLWHLRSTKPDKKSEGHPILLLHGLLQSSGSFASGGRKSLAYFLNESGFDVWLGNNRCGFTPKWNESKLKKGKWDWDLKEMVKFDVRALVEFVLDKTDYEKLTLVAHSQGTTQGFMGLVNGETIFDDGFKLVDKLENFVALAPAVYPGPLLDEKAFVRFMARNIHSSWIFGVKVFMPLMMAMRTLMVGNALFSFFSYVMFNYLFDWNDTLWDKPMRDRHFLFSPVNISVKLMEWWLSQDPSKASFKNYADDIFPDAKTWFPIEHEQPCEHEQLHTNAKRKSVDDFPRLMMFIPRQDRLVDGERLINHFINHETHQLYKVWYIDEYSHLDVLWAHDVIDRIGKPMVKSLRIPQHQLST